MRVKSSETSRLLKSTKMLSCIKRKQKHPKTLAYAVLEILEFLAVF